MLYELVVVHEATLSEAQHGEALGQLEELIVKNGGQVANKDSWGKRRLAYPIRKRRDGNFTVYHIEADPKTAVLSELNRLLRISEPVLRFLITVAETKKSKGTPALMEQYLARQAARFADRPQRSGPRGDYQRRPPQDSAPREDAPAASEHSAPAQEPSPASTE